MKIPLALLVFFLFGCQTSGTQDPQDQAAAALTELDNQLAL